ncbi:MAG: leucine-rich repeat domain-containing protein [Eubacteriales bacterium]|nr:leucine-rich repeat domain-containing protein [Eubacteriales bacterium]
MKKNTILKIATLLLASTVLLAAPSHTQAKSKNSGKVRKGITWSYSAAKDTLTIKGKGAVTTDDLKLATKNSWPVSGNSSIPKFHKIVFGNGITKIDIAFFSIEGIKSITLPKSLTSITTRSDFYNLNGDYDPWNTTLTKIKVAAKNKKFRARNNILYSKNGKTLVVYPGGKIATKFKVPSKVTKIAPYAFYGTDIGTITMGNKVTTIGNNAFENCTLKKVTLSKKLKKIGASAFVETALTTVSLPTTLTSIGSSAFSGCNLTQVVLPKNVTSIGGSAFSKNTALSSIQINSSCEIATSVFRNCSKVYDEKSGYMVYHKVQVHLGQKMTAPIDNLIDGLEKVIYFTVDANNTKYYAKDGCLYTKRGDTLLYTPELSKYNTGTDNNTSQSTTQPNTNSTSDTGNTSETDNTPTTTGDTSDTGNTAGTDDTAKAAA